MTRPVLPPLDELMPYLQSIWERRVLTNGGPLHQQLESALCDYLEVPYLSLFTNATIALTVALKALKVQGEVITTPFSFAATAHSMAWNGLIPVFADVCPTTCNLDPAAVRKAITPNTSAVMPVHCYGTPCDTEAFAAISREHEIPVIYDAAHAFGVRVPRQGLLNQGAMSVLSFHATKVYNTFEGGAIVSQSAESKRVIDRLKNFGFVDEVTLEETGINGKMSELHAAVGLSNLPHVDEHIRKRGEVDAAYRELLGGIPWIRCLERPAEVRSNYAYFPIFVAPDAPLTRDALVDDLKHIGVLARRYFYPLISTMPAYRDLPSAQASNLPVATSIASRVVCLPMYPDLGRAHIERICAHLRAM